MCKFVSLHVSLGVSLSNKAAFFCSFFYGGLLKAAEYWESSADSTSRLRNAGILSASTSFFFFKDMGWRMRGEEILTSHKHLLTGIQRVQCAGWR